jgi:hypothetical protein
VGTVGIAPTDPLLEGADAAPRALFETSIERSAERSDAVGHGLPGRHPKTPECG